MSDATRPEATRSPAADSPDGDRPAGATSIDRDALAARLTPLQFEVTQNGGTEQAFTGIYWDNHDTGHYRCIVCDEALFDSATKYESGSGWPSFWESVDPAKVRLVTDTTHGMVRTEVRCATCDAHLGHRFDDGPAPTGQRYCMNSASLRFVPATDEVAPS